MTHFLRTSSAVTLTSACIAVLSPSNAFAKVRVCQEQEQHYEQIKEAAGPPELNAALSAAADKGCLNLARRLLGDGASLASRRIIFRVGSSLAVRSSPAAVSSRTPRLIRRVISNSWAISSRAKRLASSTMTVRTPLPSISIQQGGEARACLDRVGTGDGCIIELIDDRQPGAIGEALDGLALPFLAVLILADVGCRGGS